MADKKPKEEERSQSHDDVDPHDYEPAQWKKYQEYFVEVDPDHDYKAKEIRLCSFKRPHMRAFHCSWFSFFIAVFMWFSITPLLSEIRTSLGLTNKEIWTSSIVSVAGTIVIRFILGPLCDKYGARILFSALLCLASIPTALTGIVNSGLDLTLIRLFIGIAGGTFVTCQYWTSSMFCKNVVGTANGVVAGWGNVGAGVTQLVTGSALFPLFKVFYSAYPPAKQATLAWRTVCIVPATAAFITGITILFISDDCPKGNYRDLKKYGSMPEISAAASFRSGALNFNTWIFFIHYACCFGVELTMNNAAALYFKDQFGLSTESAAAIASIFGWMNLFARGTGGFICDKCNTKWGMRGRLWVHTLVMLGEGGMILIFANSTSLAGAIATMVVFAMLVQAASGTTFGIVPYVDPPSTGSISGIVGAGGNVGAVCFGSAFRQLAPDYKTPFFIMGLVVLLSTILTSPLIFVKGHAGLFCGKDFVVDKLTGGVITVPEATLEGGTLVKSDKREREIQM